MRSFAERTATYGEDPAARSLTAFGDGACFFLRSGGCLLRAGVIEGDDGDLVVVGKVEELPLI